MHGVGDMNDPVHSSPAAAHASLLARDALHLIVMPTEKCNFRCVYCYEDFERGRMRRETIDGLKRLLDARAPGLRHLHLEWFGGEPLLEIPIVEEIQGHARDLTRESPGLRLGASMTTNGYFLTEDVLTGLVGLGIGRYQVSVDGGPEEHDRRRVRGDGEGTFGRVWRNLLAARGSRLDFEICLRVHVDRHNQAGLTAFLRRVQGELGGDPRFEVFLRPVSRLGGVHDADLPVLLGSATRTVEELRRLAADLGLRLFSGGEGPCYAAAANSFVVRSTGELAKCTVALRHPRNRVGQLHADGTARVDDENLDGWLRGLWSGVPEELSCPMKGFADPPEVSAV